MGTAKDSPGKALVRRIIDDLAARNLEPTAKEHELLALAEGLADQLEGLKNAVAADGYTTVISSGRVVINPCVAAINATSAALAKVLSQISMNELPVKNPVKQRAVAKRWPAHNLAKQRWEAGPDGAA